MGSFRISFLVGARFVGCEVFFDRLKEMSYDGFFFLSVGRGVWVSNPPSLLLSDWLGFPGFPGFLRSPDVDRYINVEPLTEVDCFDRIDKDGL